MSKHHLKSKYGKLLCLVLALMLMAGVLPAGTVSAGIEEGMGGTEETGVETLFESPESEAAPASSEESESTPNAEPTESTEPEGATYANSISGTLWLDMYDDVDNGIYAGDGIRQAVEQPFAGYNVSLFEAGDLSSAVKTTTTDANGKYKFSSLERGSYILGVKTETMDGVEYLLPLYYLDGTVGDNRFVAALDKDADAYLYAFTAPITIEADSEVTGMDAGMRTVPKAEPFYTLSASVTGYIQVLDEEGDPIPNLPWSVRAYSSVMSGTITWGTVLASGVTDANGYFNFSRSGSGNSTTSVSYGIALLIELPAGTAALRRSGRFVQTGLNPATTTHNTYSLLGSPAYSGYYNLGGTGYFLSTANQSVTVTYGISSSSPYIFQAMRQVAVTYDAQGGTVSPASANHWSINTFGTLPTPTRTGYTFDGWYTQAVGGTLISGSEVVKSIFPSPAASGTLYAHWTENSYTIAFNANGGSATPASMTRLYTQQMGTLPTITRPGYTLTGWYTAAAGGTQSSTSSSVSVLSPSLANNATLTLYAQWTLSSYTVKFDTQGGAPTPSDLTITGTNPLGTLATPTRALYDFAGWYTAVSGGTQATAASTVSSLNSSLVSGDTLTLYAQWTLAGHTITINYVDMSGTAISGHPSTSAIAADSAPYTVTAPTISGYECVGVTVDGGARDAAKAVYYNASVTGPHTITFVYDSSSTLISVTIPTKIIWASFASSGTITAPNYSITNNSSLPVDVTLASFNVTNADGVTLIASSPASGQYTLNMVGSSGLNNISGLVHGYTGTAGALGQLGIASSDKTGQFTLAGQYAGSYSIQRKPTFEAVFRFSAVLPSTTP